MMTGFPVRKKRAIPAETGLLSLPAYGMMGSEFSFFSSMTKTEMVDGIAKSAAITKKAAAAALDTITQAITKELKKGNNVVITGFGTFRVSHRAARTGVNPQNPTQKIKIKAMKVAVFKAGKALKDAVR